MRRTKKFTLSNKSKPAPKKPGKWPQECVQRAFVEGAEWWQFHQNGSTMFPAERDDAEEEAVKRYGQPR